MDSLGENIAKYRKFRNLTQKELAEEIGVNPSFISLLENGKSSATLGTVLKIASALEVPYNKFIGSENDENENKVIDTLIYELTNKTKNNTLVWNAINVDYVDKNTGIKLKDVITDRYNFYESFPRFAKYDLAFMKDCYMTEYKDDKYYMFYFILIPHDDKKVATKNTIVFLYASGKNENNSDVLVELYSDEDNAELYNLFCLVDEEKDIEPLAIKFLNRLQS